MAAGGKYAGNNIYNSTGTKQTKTQSTTAGHTIDLYEAATYKYMSTLALDGDMTTELFVFPPGV